MSFSEDDLIPISALQHHAFCPRQCALIHLERSWSENVLTAEGRVLHEKTHEAGTDYVGSVRVARGLRLRSLRLGLTGIADVVEFHSDVGGAVLPSVDGLWKPFPVEYKRGRPKPDKCDIIQLCAQAMCLEEMLSVPIAEGAIFYGQPRRRLGVIFDSVLREQTESCVTRVRQMIESGVTPPAVYASKCKACSLMELCRPKVVGAGKSVPRYLAQMLTVEQQREVVE